MEELGSEVRRNIIGFMDDFQSFRAIMLRRLTHTLERCPKTKDAEVAVKCMEELAEDLRYLIERMDAMTEELNSAYNALRRFLDIYYSIDRRH